MARTPKIHFSILVSRHQSNQLLTAQTQFIREMDDMTWHRRSFRWQDSLYIGSVLGGLNEKHKALRAKMVCNAITAEIFLAKTFPYGMTIKVVVGALYTVHKHCSHLIYQMQATLEASHPCQMPSCICKRKGNCSHKTVLTPFRPCLSMNYSDIYQIQTDTDNRGHSNVFNACHSPLPCSSRLRHIRQRPLRACLADCSQILP